MNDRSETRVDRPLVLDDAFFADPDELYRVLRPRRPVAKVATPFGVDVWMVTRYDDARAALTDPLLRKSATGFAQLLRSDGAASNARLPFTESLRTHMLNSDPPDHTRLRTLLNGAFTARAVARLRPRIEQIAAALADAMGTKAPGPVDLLAEFAYPLPITVICELLGIPEADRDRFREWTTATQFANGRHQQVAAAMQDYLVSLIDAKRASPGEDMLSAIIAASDDGDRLSEHEVLSTAFLLLVAGHDTTVNLIGNGMLRLLRDGGQRAALRAEPELIPQAVEEFLRIEGPVNLATVRFTAEPVRIGDRLIPAGQVVLISLLAANLDPDRFHDPTQLDLHRDTSGHLAFGHGIHHCLGAPLARLEGEIAFRALLDRFPDMSPAREPSSLTWRRSTLMHGLAELPVRI